MNETYEQPAASSSPADEREQLVILDGEQLALFRLLLGDLDDAYRVTLWRDSLEPAGIKVKVNEGPWSPVVGRVVER